MAWRDMAGPLSVGTQPTLGESLIDVDVPSGTTNVPIPVQPPTIPVIELHMQPVVERLDRLIALEEARLAWLQRPTVWQRLWAWIRRTARF